MYLNSMWLRYIRNCDATKITMKSARDKSLALIKTSVIIVTDLPARRFLLKIGTL